MNRSGLPLPNLHELTNEKKLKCNDQFLDSILLVLRSNYLVILLTLFKYSFIIELLIDATQTGCKCVPRYDFVNQKLRS